ncbi:MAG: DNA (cytosine-5-)-methyltransferase [Candidatus Diapherotrites archaeon CG11_big_fil_rev_8_21_14_0_20_37_9]|nr:MAG: DNA (cytosine-5-)-methyltransferase [Candidatus Diapherotrites archaeon CG11_big_fil_rev_8_21_14_0_20_37_9]
MLGNRQTNINGFTNYFSMGESKKHKVIELFAGAGGLAIGLENAGLDTVFLNDNDKDCVATLKKNKPKWNAVHGDIRELSFDGIEADVVTGGFPCQSFSHAGKRLGFEDTRGTLFFEFARCVKEVQPKIFVAENVANLERHDKGKTLKVMLDVLTDLGYDVQYKVLNALDYGTAQKRKRIFIVGTKDGLEFTYPEPVKEKKVLKDVLKGVSDSEGYSYTARRKEILSRVKPGGSWTDLPIEMQKEYMGQSFYSGGGRRGMARRISWDEPCLTLTTSPHQKQTDRIHPEETRPFTVREYARIQDFPDKWEFVGGTASKYRQIGNAVPVSLATAIGNAIAASLNQENKLQPQTKTEVSVKAKN